MHDNPLRSLPPVNAILADAGLAGLVSDLGRETVLAAVRASLEEARAAGLRGDPVDPHPGRLARRARELLEADRSTLRPVINATGILIHTGLGRAPLADEAIEAVAAVARQYCSLEIDLDSGERGRRTDDVEGLLRRLTGAEAATVVNNNAAATILSLRALAAGREVVVSRGQLVEIGGSFRLPDVSEASGARLREVGTTNRTRLSDYERAIGPDTAALMRIHTSNYRIVGFSESVGIAELAALGRSRGLWTIDDIGSGALGPGRPPVDGDDPTAAEALAAGADVVLFSGDKLLGGPQCGIMVGRRAAIGRVTSDPLMRALRVDKMTLAALGATLRLALAPARAARRIPLWTFLTVPREALRERAERLASSLRRDAGLEADPVEEKAYLGGGSTPFEPIASMAVRIGPPFPKGIESEGAFARALRAADPPVVGRVRGGAVLLDLRAVTPEQDDAIEAVVRRIASA
ncbi:L-seryl-tRNA(Sec) selenium transferase [Paludisphaera soli]|uniref:L-seryl-tRNA(Sec) selenium transferase n=1 Tax=Paludisphaera soli TaxID=2712865 RepID=UPI0013EDB8E8|nr:L-seryl-tRNA(Sec) selenium transferase [Paludisphaera soli]